MKVQESKKVNEKKEVKIYQIAHKYRGFIFYNGRCQTKEKKYQFFFQKKENPEIFIRTHAFRVGACHLTSAFTS